MACMRYVVTGGTGFIGRRVVTKLLASTLTDEVCVLVRRASLSRFERLAADDGASGPYRWSATSRPTWA